MSSRHSLLATHSRFLTPWLGGWWSDVQACSLKCVDQDCVMMFFLKFLCFWIRDYNSLADGFCIPYFPFLSLLLLSVNELWAMAHYDWICAVLIFFLFSPGMACPSNCERIASDHVVGHRLLHGRGRKCFLLFQRISRVGVGWGMLTFLVSGTQRNWRVGLGWGGVGHALTFMWTCGQGTCFSVAAGRWIYARVGWGGVGHVLTFMWTCRGRTCFSVATS